MRTFIQQKTQGFYFLHVLSLVLLILFGCAHKETTSSQSADDPPIMVDGKVALASLISLSDGHIQKLADDMSYLAQTAEAQTGQWQKIQGPLAEIAQRNISAVNWFALPDGTYWTLEQGKISEKLADRPYWSKVIKGEKVVGDLVVSKSTGQNVAIVAVPVLRPNKSVLGILGASIDLNKLNQQIKKEMDLDERYIFYAIDSTTQIALHREANMVFTRPADFGEELKKVFDEVIQHQQGFAQYQFKNTQRMVLYRKSPITNWWYAFGVVQPEK